MPMMTISKVYRDDRGRRTPDYCYVTRNGGYVQVHRFSTPEAAEAARKHAVKENR